MLSAFNDSNLGHSGIFKSSDGERKSGESLVDFSEESSGTLDLQVVLSIKLSLVDCDSEF